MITISDLEDLVHDLENASRDAVSCMEYGSGAQSAEKRAVECREDLIGTVKQLLDELRRSTELQPLSLLPPIDLNVNVTNQVMRFTVDVDLVFEDGFSTTGYAWWYTGDPLNVMWRPAYICESSGYHGMRPIGWRPLPWREYGPRKVKLVWTGTSWALEYIEDGSNSRSPSTEPGAADAGETGDAS